MVYTGDLKSPDLNSRVGSSPTPGTNFGTILNLYTSLYFNRVSVDFQKQAVYVINVPIKSACSSVGRATPS
jgi:hypothetical protein